MEQAKAEILAQLQKDILSLQGLKKTGNRGIDIGWGSVDNAFPDQSFPVAAIHEFISSSSEDKAASTGFVSGILSALMKEGGYCVWISSSRTVFPPALKLFGVQPDKVIFVDVKKDKDVLWATEESLKCTGLACVVAEIADLGFNASRRLQLAVEQSRVTGFIVRDQPRKLSITASVTRWKITSIPGIAKDNLPGLGYPRWQVDLEKVRNGKPSSWQLEWISGKFRNSSGVITSIPSFQKRKVV